MSLPCFQEDAAIWVRTDNRSHRRGQRMPRLRPRYVDIEAFQVAGVPEKDGLVLVRYLYSAYTGWVRKERIRSRTGFDKPFKYPNSGKPHFKRDR